MLDNAANFVRGSVSAVTNITATTITYTLAGPTAFPTPAAGNYNPDVGYNCTVWLSGTYNSPDLDPNAAIFRVTSLTSTVLTGYWTEGTLQPTAAGTYSVIMGPTQKYRDDSASPAYQSPWEVIYDQAYHFNAPPAQAQGYTNADGIWFGGSGVTVTGGTLQGSSSWVNTTAATANDYRIYGGFANGGFDTGQVLSATYPHKLRCLVNPSSGANTNMVFVAGFVSAEQQPAASGAGYRSTSTSAVSFIAFRVDDVNAGTTTLQCVTRVGTTETVVNLTPSGGLNQLFYLEIIANPSQAQFYVNGVLEATITTNIPTIAIGWLIGAATAGATAEVFEIDYFKMSRPK